MADISPMSRDEKLLRKLLGQDIQTEPPQSRIELLLQQLIDEGGDGGGGYKILGAYDTVEELEAAHPTGSSGDAYLVGTPSHVYTWLTESEEWHDGGEFTAIEGPEGNGIVSIEKTSTSGLVDTYTITYTDGDTDTFIVTNGAQGAPGEDGSDGAPGVGIVSIEKTGTSGLVDTYTIYLSDGSEYTFTVTNGEGSGPDYSSEIASLSTENSAQASEISSLNTLTSEHTSELSSLSDQNSTQSSQLTSMETVTSETAVSMSEVSSAAASTSTAQSEVDSEQNSTLESLSTANSELNSEVESLQSELDEKANGYPIPPSP